MSGEQLTFAALMEHHGFTGTMRTAPKAAPMPAPRPVEAISMQRYHASAAQRRLYGGNTITEFRVAYADDPQSAKTITGYGPTPGDRKTDAIRRFRSG